MKIEKKHISFFHPAALISTCFGIGKSPVAPGTMGSIFAVILVVIIAFLPRLGVFDKNLLLPFFAVVTIVTIIKGFWACGVYEKRSGKKDPSEIVIDEVAGIFVAVLFAALIYAFLLWFDEMKFSRLLALSHYYLLTLFLLFRLFDIWKPWIIGRIQNEMKGAAGVMMDDIVAGVFAALVFHAMFLLLVYSGVMHKIFEKYYPHMAAFV